MLCCLWQDPNAQTVSGVSPFPGQRRPLMEAGNAQAAGPLMVNVVVPAGMKAGQTIQVAAPDGSRTVSATIPQGASPGQSFCVSFPPPGSAGSTNGSQQSNSSSKNGVYGGQPVQSTHAAPISQPIYTPAPAPAIQSSPAPTNALPPVMPPVVSPRPAQAVQSGTPFSQALDGPSPPNRRPHQTVPPQSAAASSSQPQKLLLVNVPPGSQPGSTLYVQVPGENRTLAAKVPVGVTQFHVSYRPSAAAASSAPPPAALPPPIPAPAPAPAPPTPMPTTTNNGQKLILVRVPPGTTPGTTLHVEIPDEPGRILAAQVPPHASEFQVAYVPRPPTNPVPAYDVPVRPPAPAGGTAMLPYLGGAALAGAAGVAMYDHYHHPPAYEGYGEYVDTYGDPGAYDYGGDYGGYDGY